MQDMGLRPAGSEAIDALSAALDTVLSSGLDPADAAEARDLIARLETQGRRLRAAQVELLDTISRRGLHRPDGHASAKVMVRHVANLSTAEASRRAASAKALRDLPTVAAAFAAGRIGACQVERIARTHANPRIRTEVVANDDALATHAEAQTYTAFHQMVSDWERLVDQDGARDRNQRAHDNRDAKIIQDYDGTWTITASCGSLQGAEAEAIFKAYLKAEVLADWDKARAEHGDAATAADLPRTDAQRRYDALFEIFQRAAAHHASSDGGSQIVTDIVIDQTTYEHLAHQLTHTDHGVSSPQTPDPARSPFPARGFRCSTLDGNPIEPTEAVAHSLLGHIRRVIIGSDSVVIDLGRRRRLFTGPAALAVKLSATECYWPGCHVPVTDCQTDHLDPWSTHKGRTNPRNGGPACGRHNRLKTHGYRAWRDPTGTWHTHRPDGTEIT